MTTTYRVVFSPEAEGQLIDLYRFLAAEASPDIAARYTDGIVAQCEALQLLPFRGTPRDDVRPGLRTLSYRRRTIIAFTVVDDRVEIIGIFYGGQDWERRGGT